MDKFGEQGAESTHQGAGVTPIKWGFSGLCISGDYPGCLVCSFLGGSVFLLVLKG